MAGHLGVNKTIKKIRTRFYWQGLSDDVETYIRQCPRCNQAKNPPKPRKAPLGSIPVGYPLEKVCLDLVGALPKSINGFEHIVVVVDLFTKWQGLTTKNQDAPEPEVAEVMPRPEVASRPRRRVRQPQWLDDYEH